MNFYLGIDFGTSGARAVVIDDASIIKAEVEQRFELVAPEYWAAMWQKALFNLIEQLPRDLRAEINAIAINGTSSTVMLCDQLGNVLNTPLLYNDGRGVEVLETLQAIAPANNIVLSATSSLAKLLWMSKQPFFNQGQYLLHQADYLAYLLHGKLGISDYHNALKLGYDVEKLAYPAWLTNLAVMPLLPQVLAPGKPIGEVTPAINQTLGLRNDCLVCAGTTDSIAAFLASGAIKPGEAVTSLGSTLVLKLLSRTRVENAELGIYSHRLGDLWLTGGASDTGGAVLRHFFSEAELASLSSQIEAHTSNLDYYPLLKMGDRFPINDPLLPPRLEPRPDSDVEFLHGLLESMARIEAKGYELLQQLGADKLTCVYTAGGGAKNSVWTRIRGFYLQVPMLPPIHTAAAYGTALLAMQAIKTG
ncbi:FGGY-family carbohydrate kinase [Chlorogloea sp. CCALA 695]|uniref:FGGY-family carbohydrate kinase n=1 Tax=Chlorogloea sp. CCALA 695 TaxID=2107693 RepID=UPI000D060105|nr:FGGY-family carbohydrate kinase [Chlorogloea sp. CCALA 695]PSB32864.1 carbohydrate kinase [Chlorogloea sp. CCALA 695]